MSKKMIILLFMSVVFFSNLAYGIGLGVNVGQPHNVALSLKSANSKNSYDLAVSWAGGGLYLHGDYLLSTYVLSRRVPLYAGLGLRTRINEGNSDVGIRIPLGMSIYFSKLEVFLEIAPSLMVLPDMNFNADPSQSYGIGLRYHFSF